MTRKQEIEIIKDVIWSSHGRCFTKYEEESIAKAILSYIKRREKPMLRCIENIVETIALTNSQREYLKSFVKICNEQYEKAKEDMR